ncbi:5667_t:CDS:2 [Paraglomus occultum]|uniref:H/ACA ribonucleoprotein complex non-core subunit NAF1 n=1 Tax=Paraglomus occultum TaxID=144539 RepID=A0A9N8Z6S1_9GLOM|nr:5667_t:CDS:2 [Paraglomus occultum]
MDDNSIDQQTKEENESNESESTATSSSGGDSSEASFASDSDTDDSDTSSLNTDDSDTDSTDETEVFDLFAEATKNGEILHTRNEIVKIPIRKPNVEIRDNMPIDEIGSVYNIVENAVTVIAKVSGEYQVLDSGSIFVFEDRHMLGEVFETFGPVSQPMYAVLFDNASEIDPERVKIGTKIYSVRQYANYVFTKPLREQKGSDASNLYDEEPNESEIEFSDDEKEAEYKLQLKKSNPGRGGSSKSRGRGGRSLQKKNNLPPVKGEDDPYGYNILRRPQQTPPTSITQTYNVAHSVGPASSTHSTIPTISHPIAPSMVQPSWPAVNSPPIMTHPPIQPHMTQPQPIQPHMTQPQPIQPHMTQPQPIQPHMTRPQPWQTQIHPQMQHGFQYQQGAVNAPPAHVDIGAIPQQQQYAGWNQGAYGRQVNNFGNASGFHQ